MSSEDAFDRSVSDATSPLSLPSEEGRVGAGRLPVKLGFAGESTIQSPPAGRARDPIALDTIGVRQ